MRFSRLYAPTLRDAPADADLVSIKLLVRGGFVRKVAAGIYSFLPLGLRVLKKIEEIVRQEMNAIGSQEILCQSYSQQNYGTRRADGTTMAPK
ncbi:MAG TPA: hypothetical protein PKN37_00390 [Mesotoga sp.]|nr:hypothetical protein [Mesotoga sp.]